MLIIIPSLGGVDRAGESNGGKMGTTVIEQLLKKFSLNHTYFLGLYKGTAIEVPGPTADTQSHCPLFSPGLSETGGLNVPELLPSGHPGKRVETVSKDSDILGEGD